MAISVDLAKALDKDYEAYRYTSRTAHLDR